MLMHAWQRNSGACEMLDWLKQTTSRGYAQRRELETLHECQCIHPRVDYSSCVR